MKNKIPFIYIPLIILFIGCVRGKNDHKEKTTIENISVNPNAHEDVNKILKYFLELPNKEDQKVISAQNCCHGNEITSCYKAYVEALNEETGFWPGMIGVDYEYTNRFTIEQLSECNQYLIDYWNKGGLITINWAPHNPWTDKGTRDQSVVKIQDLYNPGSDIYNKWHGELDRIATGLDELQKAGVVVLWRPMQEMNGNWFWWGSKSSPDNPEHFKKVYQDMFHYFTEEKKLNNLIWVYSISVHCGGEYSKEPAYYYPGDDYVDIVGTNVYESEGFSICDYEAIKALGKPVALTECGPDHAKMDGSFDNTWMIEAIKFHAKDIIYWTTWHDWPDHFVSMVSNKKAKELLEDPWVITRDEINWR
jgi:mannan endo-1,4-beta-mannosidase